LIYNNCYERIEVFSIQEGVDKNKLELLFKGYKTGCKLTMDINPVHLINEHILNVL